MNSVSPAAVQYGSPEGTRRAEGRDAVTGRHAQSKMGYQGGAREGETDEVEKIKSKLLTAWNNVKYALERTSQVPDLSVYVSQDCTDNYLLYLDPHYCQPYIDTSKDDFPLESFHCNSPRKISITRMDPSCTIAFYSRNRTDFAALCADLSRVLGSPTAEEKYPIFSIADGQAQEYEEGSHRCSHTPARPPKARLAKKLSSDEFVFL
ncbi:hypothetical protein FKM82_025848 [Ascaphus truei]